MTQQIEALKNLIAIGADEIGGEAQQAAHELITLLNADADALQAQAEAQAVFDKSGTDRPMAELWDKANLAGFGDIFADLLNAEGLKANGHSIRPQQAFFCGWYSMYKRIGGKKLLAQVELPTTMTEVAGWLNRERQTLYGWMASDWFIGLGVDSWVTRGLVEIIPNALKRLNHNVVFGNGPVSNTAIKTVLDAHRGKQPEVQQAAQVNIFNGKLVILPQQDG